MGLFWGKSRPSKGDFNVEDYDDMHKFADEWQFEFADILDCDEDEGYEEACDYWRKYH